MRVLSSTFQMSPSERDEAVLAAELQKVQQQEGITPVNRCAPHWKAKQELPPEKLEMRRANRNLKTSEVLARLKAELPDLWAVAEVVGSWVWISTPSKPSEEVREKLKDFGFCWNRKREAWQHSCAAWSGHSKADPRMRYVSCPATEFEPANITTA